MWSPLIAELKPKLRRLIPDLPRHDRSRTLRYRSRTETLDLIVTLLEAESAEAATVVGCSLGAQPAILLASRRPDLVRDVLVISAQATPSRLSGPTLGLLGLSAPLARNERFARLQASELFIPEKLMRDYLSTSKHLTSEMLPASVGENFRFTVPSEWGTFPERSLLLIGAEERTMMRASARLLANAQAGSELDIVENCGHGIPLQKPAWLARRLESRLG